MKYLFFLPVFLLLVASTSSRQVGERQPVIKPLLVSIRPELPARRDTPATEDAEHYMQEAWYEYGTSQAAPPATAKNEFVVLANPACKATDFVSSYEQWLRDRLASRADTAFLYSMSDWRGLTPRQKHARRMREQATYYRQADSLHQINNHKGYYQVWLLNNSTDTITLGTQDASLVCVLQARNKDQKWQPVQYWRFSGCGNSYIAKFLLPKEHICFLAKPLQRGSFRTKLRYKMAGIKKFYYSNEFEGHINYGEFTEKPTPRPRLLAGKPVVAFKLDSLPRTYYLGCMAFHHRPKGVW